MEHLKDLTMTNLQKDLEVNALRDRKEIYNAIQSHFVNKNETLDDGKKLDNDDVEV